MKTITHTAIELENGHRIIDVFGEEYTVMTEDFTAQYSANEMMEVYNLEYSDLIHIDATMVANQLPKKPEFRQAGGFNRE